MGCLCEDANPIRNVNDVAQFVGVSRGALNAAIYGTGTQGKTFARILGALTPCPADAVLYKSQEDDSWLFLYPTQPEPPAGETVNMGGVRIGKTIADLLT